MTDDHPDLPSLAPPRGTRDQSPGQTLQLAETARRLVHIVAMHGYQPIDVPVFEPMSLFDRLYGPSIRGRLITLSTDTTYALRPDLTAGMCRWAASDIREHQVRQVPRRIVSHGLVFRHERPRPLRLRQFTQVGVERIGDEDASSKGADLELLSVARLALWQSGLPGGLLRVGHAGVRAEYLARICGGDVEATRVLGSLLDALSRLRLRLNPPRTGADRVVVGDETVVVPPIEHPDLDNLLIELRRSIKTALGTSPPEPTSDNAALVTMDLLENRLDDVGKDLGLSGHQRDALQMLTHAAASPEELADNIEPLFEDAVDTLVSSLGHVSACTTDLEPLVLRFNIACARGLGYYTGLTFEVDVPALGPDVGQVLGGGRYDDALANISGEPGGAGGFAIGVERLVAATRAAHGERATYARVSEAEPVLMAFGAGPGDMASAARLAELLKGRRVSVAVVPEPVSIPCDDDPAEWVLRAYKSLGHCHRYAVLVVEGELFLADYQRDLSFAMERGDLFTMLTH